MIQSEPNAYVSVTNSDGILLVEWQAGSSGTSFGRIDGNALRSGDTLIITAKARGKLSSLPVMVTLPDAPVSAQPSITDMVYGSYQIRGTAPMNSWVGLYKDNVLITSTQVYYNGEFYLYPYYTLGEHLQIVVREKGKAASPPLSITYGVGYNKAS